MPRFTLGNGNNGTGSNGDDGPGGSKRNQERERLNEKQKSLVQSNREKNAVPVPYEPRCSVCNSPHRDFIDAMLARGAANYTALSDKVPGLDGRKLDRRAIANHAKNHLGYTEDAIRKILEEEAFNAAQDYEENVKGALTRRGALEVGLRKAFEDMTAGRIDMEVKDMLAIIQTLEKMDEATNAAAVDQMRMQTEAFIRAIREEVDDESVWERIVGRAKRIIQQQGYTYEPTVEATVQELPPPNR